MVAHFPEVHPRTTPADRVRGRFVILWCVSWCLLLPLSVASALLMFTRFDWDQAASASLAVLFCFALLLALGRWIKKALPSATRLALTLSFVAGVICLATCVWFGAQVWFGGKPVLSVVESKGRYFTRSGSRELSEQEHLELKSRDATFSITFFGIVLSAMAVISSLYLLGTIRRAEPGLPCAAGADLLGVDPTALEQSDASSGHI